MQRFFWASGWLFWVPGLLWAQQGDKAGHEMRPPPEEWNLPAPVLEPKDGLRSFRFGEEGFVLELVAAEPLVENPVCLAFDGNGRPWVCEMRDYMPDVDGKGEDARTGRITILLDRDGDGVAEEARRFLEGLHLPRAIQLVEGGILWGDEDHLYFTERVGEDGLSAGKTEVVHQNWSPGGNVEHKANGLIYGLDNWLYAAKSDWRYRRVAGKWVREKTEYRGQWGIAQDDQGRLVTNTNSNLIAAEVIYPGQTVRNPHHAFRSPVSVRMDNKVYPIRITSGVNRGYQEGTLDERGFLAIATATGGLTVYRGDQFPEEYAGNVFIPEPAGLLVKRAILEEKDGVRKAKAAYAGREFLASVDERSRVVNAHTAPDGTLYLVDLYHGIVQHKTYVTTYLREQILKRGLDQGNLDRGRIYRVRHEGKALGGQPAMEGQGSAELVSHLEHANGWWRDTAQRLIVERGGLDAMEALRRLLVESGDARARSHALWCLEGLGAVEPGDVAVAVTSGSAVLEIQGLRVAAGFAGGPQAAEVAAILEQVPTGVAAPGRWVLGATLAAFPESAGVVVRLLREDSSLATRDWVMSGLAGREVEWLERALVENLSLWQDLAVVVGKRGGTATAESLFNMLSEGAVPDRRRDDLLKALGKVAMAQRNGKMVEALLRGVKERGWEPGPLWEGLAQGGAKKDFKPVPVSRGIEGSMPAGNALAEKVVKLLDVGGGQVKSYLTTKEHRRQYEIGEVEYAKLCAACHHLEGTGMVALAPPLVDSEWVTGPERRLIALTMEGMMGPVTVNGKLYEPPEVQPVMPGLRLNPELSDEKLAAILTYVRNSWGNTAPAVKPEAVADWRSGKSLRAPFTEAELLEME